MRGKASLDHFRWNTAQSERDNSAARLPRIVQLELRYACEFAAELLSQRPHAFLNPPQSNVERILNCHSETDLPGNVALPIFEPSRVAADHVLVGLEPLRRVEVKGLLVKRQQNVQRRPDGKNREIGKTKLEHGRAAFDFGRVGAEREDVAARPGDRGREKLAGRDDAFSPLSGDSNC